MEVTETITDEEALIKRLKELSIKYGKAWTFSIKPFSHVTRFLQFRNPSSVPDQFIDRTNNIRINGVWQSSGTIAWKGEIRGFTSAAVLREHNRGFGKS